jgi:hypothetical protein
VNPDVDQGAAVFRLPTAVRALSPGRLDRHPRDGSDRSLTRGLGGWALTFLLLTLTLTPLRKYTGWTWLARLRRMMGLYAFFYASAHMTSYLGLDQRFDWQAIIEDVSKRPFMVAGMLGIRAAAAARHHLE